MIEKLRTKRPSHATVVAYLSLFVALGTGSAYAANTVFSSDIVDGEVKEADIGQAAVATSEIKNDSVANGDVAPNSIASGRILDATITGADVADNALKGADIDESTLSSIGGGGPAGGDLTGTYPNPSIRSNAVGSGKVADNSLSGFDINESTLGAVPNADALGGRPYFDFVQADSSFLTTMPLVKVETDGPAQTVLETSRVDIRTTGTPQQLAICVKGSFSHAIPVVQYTGGSATSAAAARDYDALDGDDGFCTTMAIGAAANTDGGDFTIMVPGGVVWGSPWVQSSSEWDPDDYTLMGFGLGVQVP